MYNVCIDQSISLKRVQLRLLCMTALSSRLKSTFFYLLFVCPAADVGTLLRGQSPQTMLIAAFLSIFD